MKSKLFVTLLLAATLSAMPLFAQAKYSLTVALADSLTGEPVSFASIYISKDGTPEGAYYAATNEKGVGVISDIPSGSYIFKAEMMGFIGRTIKVDIKKDLDMGVVKMAQDVTMLAAATVTATGNAVIVKKDTIVYNASAFKTTENDMLEDLLKKLTGVEVSSDGTITAQGKTISKVMIDGKEFFLDDPQLATKNIPAKVVDKVKVVQKKSEQAEFTGIDDGEEETVLDLTVKPGMMDSWFGTITGGAGHDLQNEEHDLRYQGSAMISRFTEESQISIIANGNNTNNRGFNDMTGSTFNGMRSYGGRRNMNSSGGITTSWMGGVNGNLYIKGEKERELGGNYMYSGSVNDVIEESTRTTFLDDTQSLVSKNNSTGSTFNDGHRAGIVFDYKFTDKTSLMFRPYFRYGNNRFDEQGTFSTDNTLSGKVNDGVNESSGSGSSWTTGGRMLLRQKIGETKGRTVSLWINYSLSQNGIIGDNYSVTNTYSGNIKSDSTIIDQNYNRKENSYSFSANLTYTEPLGRNFFLMGSYRFGWSKNVSEKMTYDNITSLLEEDYSSRMNNTFINHRMQLSMMKQESKYNLQIGFNAQPYTTHSVSSLGYLRDTTYTVWNFAPSARFDYRFSDNNFLRLNYNGRTTQPTINQLMPIPDKSNPLYVSLGNLMLNPSFSHRLWVDYNYNDTKTFATYAIMGNFNYTKDAIINASWYDAAGVQYTAPVNSTKPTLDGSLMAMISSPIAKSDFSISSFTRASVTSSLTYTGNDTTARTLEEIKDDLIGGRTTSMGLYEKLTFSYRNDYVDIRVGGSVSYKNAWYEISSQKKARTFDNQVFAEITGTLPWGMEVRTDANYNFYNGYDPGYGDPMLMWNAEISQSFLKNKLILRFKVYDILNQAKNNYRTTTDNYVEDVYNNTLGQYFMFTLTYKFGDFSNMSKGNRRRGPGGPPR